MSPKIHSSFWKDDDVAELSVEQKLAFLWLITCGRANNAGFLKVSYREFTQDTGLPERVLEEVCKALPRGLKRDGKNIWIVQFMRHQWSPGMRRHVSNLYGSLCDAVLEMPTVWVDEVLQEYPELYIGLREPSRVSKSLKPLGEAGKSLEGTRTEQNRTEQNRSLSEGESEGNPPPPAPPPEVQRNGTPTLEQALAYIAKHVPGPGYTPAEVTAAWHSLEAGRDEMGRWPWGRGIVGDWRSAVISRIETQRKFGTAKNGQANSTSKRLELESQQRAIRQAIAESPANEASAAFRLDFTAEEKSALSELRRRDREISEALAKGLYQ